MAQVQLDQNGRIIAVSQDTPLPLGVRIDLPEGFDIMTHGKYRIVDGALVYDPLPVSPAQPGLIDTLAAMVIDQEYRLILMEMGAKV